MPRVASAPRTKQAPTKLDYLIALFTAKPTPGNDVSPRGDITQEERDVLACLIIRRNPAQQDRCDPSIPTIAADCRMTERLTKRAIRSLEQKGYIRVHERTSLDPTKPRNLSNQYTILWGPPTWIGTVVTSETSGNHDPKGGGGGVDLDPRGGVETDPRSSNLKLRPRSVALGPGVVTWVGAERPDPTPVPAPVDPLPRDLVDRINRDIITTITGELAMALEGLLEREGSPLANDAAGIWSVAHEAARTGRYLHHIAAGVLTGLRCDDLRGIQAQVMVLDLGSDVPAQHAYRRGRGYLEAAEGKLSVGPYPF